MKLALSNLHKHRAIIQSQNKITAKQRKAFNCLLSIAKSQIKKSEKKDKFIVNTKELKKMISDKKINFETLKKSLEELQDIKSVLTTLMKYL